MTQGTVNAIRAMLERTAVVQAVLETVIASEMDCVDAGNANAMGITRVPNVAVRAAPTAVREKARAAAMEFALVIPDILGVIAV